MRLVNGLIFTIFKSEKTSKFSVKISMFMLLISTQENFTILKDANNQRILKSHKIILKKKQLKDTLKRIIIEELN